MTRYSGNRLAPLYSIGMILLGLIALVYVVTALPVDALSEVQIENLSLTAVLTITLLHMFYLLLAVEVWRRIVFVITGKCNEFADAYLQMVSVAVGKYVPGKIWGIVARTGQLSKIGVSAQMSLVSSVMEQLVAFLGGGIVLVAAAFFVFPDYTLLVALAGAALLATLVALTRRVPEITRWLQHRQGISEETPPVVDDGIGYWLRFSLAHAVLWLVSGVVLCIIYFSLFGATVTVQGVAALILANTIGFIVGFLAVFAPGGLGVREATTVAILAPFFPMREVLIAAIAMRAWIVLFDGINCGLMLIAEFRHVARSAK